MDSGLITYSNSYKSNINILKLVYHQALRTSCYAFSTTFINNITTEIGLPALENTLNLNKFIIGEHVKNTVIAEKVRKSPFAIDYCLSQRN